MRYPAPHNKFHLTDPETFGDWLVQAFRPHVVCELGQHVIINISKAAANSCCPHVYLIGQEASLNENSTQTEEDASPVCGHANVTIVRRSFAEAASEWTKLIDLLCINEAQSYDDIKNVFFTWFNFVRPGGIVLLNGIFECAGNAGRLFNELNLPKFSLPCPQGLGVLLKPLVVEKNAQILFPPSFSKNRGEHSMMFPGMNGEAPSSARPAAGSKKFGIVIGTFAALPYVHLHLEARRRFYPDVPALIHDDGSFLGSQLEALAAQYGAEFVTHPVRHLQFLGDLSVYPVGLEWGFRRGLTYLLKLSRRWIWLEDWRPSLSALFNASGAATASNRSIGFGFGFRTECVAFEIRKWYHSDFMEDVQKAIDSRKDVFVENYVHVWAQRLADPENQTWRKWVAEHPVPEERSGYALWDFMGECRQMAQQNRLWHNSNTPEEYAALAQSWCLPYQACDFLDPNCGWGIGHPNA